MKKSRKQHKFQIIKASGRPEHFSREKLFNSLTHTGLPSKTCDHITEKVCEDLSEGIRTRDIYRKTLNLLGQSSRLAAVHYSLKRALLDLGPMGHHFETYVARYFNAKGFSTKNCEIIQGKFIRHEVDVTAEKSGEKFFAECKFHNRPGIKNDIKIALYVKARWEDLKLGPQGKNLQGFYLVSNTAFTGDALTYAKGTGLNLLGVNAPEKLSFLDEIKQLKLYPVTSLKRLNRRMKNICLNEGLILARDLLGQDRKLLRLGFEDRDISTIIQEIESLSV